MNFQRQIFIFKSLLKKDKVVKCPFCGWSGATFMSAGVAKKRDNAACPVCGSLERHRLLYLYLQEKLDKNKKLKLLHFAPEKIITNFFKSFTNVDYLSVDIDEKAAMRKEDITKLSFSDNSFDFIFCSHVLEHIEDDKKAMSELFRVLKSGGQAILQVPITDNEATYEDFSIKSPEEREKHFGQKDHVRLYGKDYLTRLESVGFKVKRDDFYKTLSQEDIKKFVIFPADISDEEKYIYLCTK